VPSDDRCHLYGARLWALVHCPRSRGGVQPSRAAAGAFSPHFRGKRRERPSVKFQETGVWCFERSARPPRVAAECRSQLLMGGPVPVIDDVVYPFVVVALRCLWLLPRSQDAKRHLSDDDAFESAADFSDGPDLSPATSPRALEPLDCEDLDALYDGTELYTAADDMLPSWLDADCNAHSASSVPHAPSPSSFPVDAYSCTTSATMGAMAHLVLPARPIGSQFTSLTSSQALPRCAR
jgi:hypothetical protein